MNQIDLGKRIRQERLSTGMTQEQLAEAINVSATYIGYIERGERSATLSKLVQIANTFHISIDYLLQDSVPLSSSVLDKQLLSLWNQASEGQKNMIIAVIKSILTNNDSDSPDAC